MEQALGNASRPRGPRTAIPATLTFTTRWTTTHAWPIPRSWRASGRKTVARFWERVNACFRGAEDTVMRVLTDNRSCYHSYYLAAVLGPEIKPKPHPDPEHRQRRAVYPHHARVMNLCLALPVGGREGSCLPGLVSTWRLGVPQSVRVGQVGDLLRTGQSRQVRTVAH